MKRKLRVYEILRRQVCTNAHSICSVHLHDKKDKKNALKVLKINLKVLTLDISKYWKLTLKLFKITISKYWNEHLKLLKINFSKYW
jgi:hypothetical protein